MGIPPIIINGYTGTVSNPNDCHLAFYTNTFGNTAIERMRITSAGNIGIGTIPSTKLHVSKGSNLSPSYSWMSDRDNVLIEGQSGISNIQQFLSDFDSRIAFSTLTQRNAGIIGYNCVDGYGYWNSAFGQNFNFIVGNVGIGTTAPTSKLQVVGLPVHANNAAAVTAGLTAGAFYHAGDGIVRVVF